MRILVPLILSVAVAIALIQVINWDKVAKEYKPVIDAYHEIVDVLPSGHSVAAGNINDAEVIQRDLQMLVDVEEDEIDNINYNWLRTMGPNCGPDHKAIIQAAFANDGIIRENEYYIIISACNDYNNSQESGAKRNLKEYANE